MRNDLLPTTQEGQYAAVSSAREWWAAQQARVTLRKSDPAYQDGEPAGAPGCHASHAWPIC